MTTEPDNIAKALHGTWLLVSCSMALADGTVLYPYGNAPAGAILYNADGWMACQMVNPAEEAGRADAASAYYGRFTIDASRSIVTHHVVWSSTDSVAGDAIRHVRIEGDCLTLSARSGDAKVEVRWRRASAAA